MTSQQTAVPHASVGGDLKHGDNDVDMTIAEWLDDRGIPPIVVVAAVAVASVQLIIIGLLLIRCILMKRARDLQDDYERLGADYFLIEREKKSAQKQARKWEEAQKMGMISLKRQTRRSASQPNLQMGTKILTESPVPLLERRTQQLGARVPGRKSRVSPAPERGVSMKEDESSAAQKRMLYAGTKSQSTPRDLFRASMESPEQMRVGGEADTIEGAIPASADMPPSPFGQISFSVTYDKELEQVKIFVEQATLLSVRTAKGAADTFVKVSLTPEQGIPPSVSRVVRKNVKPVYRHNFIFRVAAEAVTDLVVKFQVFELDTFSHEDLVGEVEYALSQDPDLNRAVIVWRDLHGPRMVQNVPRGKLLFSLTYLPNAEKLTLVVLRARNLRLPEWGRQAVGKDGLSYCTNCALGCVVAYRIWDIFGEKHATVLDTFVKVTLVKSGKVMKYKQSRLCRKSCHPVYNEGFALKVRQSDLDDVCITLAVCVRLNHLGFHRVIGRCIVGRHVGADGSSHWRDMINTPRSAVCQWHVLI